MKKCNSCGEIIRPDAVFCPLCGSRDLSDIKGKKKRSYFGALIKAVLCAVFLFAVQFAVSFVYTVVVTILAIARMGLEGELLEAYVLDHYARNSAVIGIVSNVIALVILVLYFFAKGRKITAELGMKRYSPILVPICAMLGYALQYVIVFITDLVPWPVEWLADHSEDTEIIMSGNIVLVIVGVSIITGLIEEIVFRALSIGRLGRAFSAPVCVVISAVIFGAAHLQPVQSFYATILGLLLGSLYVRFGSVWPCIITHLSFNLAGIIGLPSNSAILYYAVLAVSIGLTIIFSYVIFNMIPQAKENKTF